MAQRGHEGPLPPNGQARAHKGLAHKGPAHTGSAKQGPMGAHIRARPKWIWHVRAQGAPKGLAQKGLAHKARPIRAQDFP